MILKNRVVWAEEKRNEREREEKGKGIRRGEEKGPQTPEKTANFGEEKISLV